VLALILAHGNLGRAVDQNVRGLQHGIGEKAGVDVVGILLGLVLELGHAAKLAVARDRGQRPRQLGVLAHRRLHEQRGFRGIDATRDEIAGHLAHPPAMVSGSKGWVMAW
jgi:hypothetical protein